MKTSDFSTMRIWNIDAERIHKFKKKLSKHTSHLSGHHVISLALDELEKKIAMENMHQQKVTEAEK